MNTLIHAQDMKKIVLMGNPNVGKSLIFSRLTGTKVVTSNFPGTTVSITNGTFTCTHKNCSQHQYNLIDAPGIYSFLEHDQKSEIENTANRIMQNAEIIINIIDATNLERNLLLTLELNMWDEAEYHGIKINIRELSIVLGVPVIPTIGLTGKGITQLVEELFKPPTEPENRFIVAGSVTWDLTKKIVARVQTKTSATKLPHYFFVCLFKVFKNSFQFIFFNAEACINNFKIQPAFFSTKIICANANFYVTF